MAVPARHTSKAKKAIGKRLRKRNGAFISVYNIVSFFNQIPNDNKKV